MYRASALEALSRWRRSGATDPDTDLRDTLLALILAAGVLCALLTETLGAVGGLTFWPLVLGWGVALVAAGVFLGRHAHRPARLARPALRPGLDLAMAGWVGVVLALTGAVALLGAPSVWDSMSYHLARVAHWAQDRSIAFYPTHIRRQLYQPPWAEFAMLQLYVLGRGDRLVNLVQWVCMAGSLLGVGVVARQLGAGARGQLLSVFVCATVPMGIMQSATTQNDYALALWLVCLTSALLALAARPGLGPLLAAGTSLGLAILTKGTAYLLAAPLVVALLLGVRARSLSRRVAYGLVVVACAAALNAPQYLRNAALFGSPLGPGGEGGNYTYLNREVSLPILGSNIVRNVGLHLGTPWGEANHAVERAIDTVHRAIGIATDDPRSTWPTTRFEVVAPMASEDHAGNGLHLVLIAAALIAASGQRASPRLRALAAALVVAFILFCLLLRWQPWHSRIQLPLFVLAAPLVGVVFERVRSSALGLVALILAGSSAYFLTTNHARPLFGGESVLTVPWADQRTRHAGPSYVDAARFLASSECRDVGLALSSNDPEYFLWGLLADAGWRGRLEAVHVANESADLPYARGAFRPCALVRVGKVWDSPGAGLTLDEQYFRPVWSRNDLQVLLSAPGPPGEATAASGPAEARLVLERSRFQPGDRVTIGLVARSPLGEAPADLYVGLILPDSRSAVFVGPSGLLSDAVSLGEADAFPRARLAAPGFALDAPRFAEFTVPSDAPPGVYEMFAGLVKRRTPRAKRILPEDVIASAVHRIIIGP